MTLPAAVSEQRLPANSPARGIDPPSNGSGERLPMIDAVRFLCVIWVMWIHIPESPELENTTAFARFRLPVFVILSIFFLFTSQKNRPGRTFAQYARERIRTLYIPFLGWAAIYYFVHAYCERFVLGNGWLPISNGILIHGQALHLWFVPFIVLVGLLTYPVAGWLLTRPFDPRWIIAVALSAGLLLSACVPTLTDAFIDFNYRIHLKDFLYRAITLGPCIPLGIAAYFLFVMMRKRFGSVPRSLGYIGLTLFAVCIAMNGVTATNPLLETVAGFAVVLIAFHPTQSPFWLWIAQYGRFAYGMYLMHLLFIDIAKLFRTACLHIAPSWQYDVLTLVVCVFLSLFFCIAMSRNRYTRWLVPTHAPVVGQARFDSGRGYARQVSGKLSCSDGV